MFQKLLHRLHRSHGKWAGAPEMEGYYASLQRDGRGGGPTFDEAHQDHEAFLGIQLWNGLTF